MYVHIYSKPLRLDSNLKKTERINCPSPLPSSPSSPSSSEEHSLGHVFISPEVTFADSLGSVWLTCDGPKGGRQTGGTLRRSFDWAPTVDVIKSSMLRWCVCDMICVGCVLQTSPELFSINSNCPFVEGEGHIPGSYVAWLWLWKRTFCDGRREVTKDVLFAIWSGIGANYRHGCSNFFILSSTCSIQVECR